jgi:hypothetical protein
MAVRLAVARAEMRARRGGVGGGERPWARVGSPEGSTTCEVVSRLGRMQFEHEGPQLTRNPTMKYAKGVADSYSRAGSMSAITFVRAAGFVTVLLVATLTIEFLVLAVVFSVDTAVPVGLDNRCRTGHRAPTRNVALGKDTGPSSASLALDRRTLRCVGRMARRVQSGLSDHESSLHLIERQGDVLRLAVPALSESARRCTPAVRVRLGHDDHGRQRRPSSCLPSLSNGQVSATQEFGGKRQQPHAGVASVSRWEDVQNCRGAIPGGFDGTIRCPGGSDRSEGTQGDLSWPVPTRD